MKITEVVFLPTTFPLLDVNDYDKNDLFRYRK